MTSAIRFSAGHARVCALRSRLWTPLDRGLVVRAGVEPDGRAISGDLDVVFPPLVQWYVIVLKMFRPGREAVTWLFRLHEIENLKLLWRGAVRARDPNPACWRPLEPLATVMFEPVALAPEELVQRLAHTPYGAIARALFRSHPADLAAAEMGLDRWLWTHLYDEARHLPARESAAFGLLRLLVVEHDLDVLRRGTAFGLDADLVAKATVVLSAEHDVRTLARAAEWTPVTGPLSAVLPSRIARSLAGAADWDEAIRAIRRRRLLACRRAFLGWPFSLAPALAALLLRDAQARAALSVAAARRAGRLGEAALSLALAASPLER